MNNNIRKVKQHFSELRQYGFVFAIFETVIWTLRNWWKTAVFDKKKCHENKYLNGIFKEWKEEYQRNYFEIDRNDIFYKCFEQSYKDSCEKLEKNKKNNFSMKYKSLLPFIIITIIFFGGKLISNIHMLMVSKDIWKALGKMDWSFSISGTVFYVLALILTASIIKWIDVKKYQETWVRHSNQKYQMEREMYKFIDGLGEYYSNEFKIKKFKKNIIKIWDDNQKKFLDNMKNEKKLGINLDMLKSKFVDK